MKDSRILFIFTIVFCATISWAELDYQDSPAYKKMVEQMERFKPKDFSPPKADSPIIGHWSNRKDGFYETTLTMFDDGLGILGAAIAGVPLFWQQEAEIIHVTLPDSPDIAPKDFEMRITYDQKMDTLLLKTGESSQKNKILYRTGKRYGRYSDRKEFIPGPDEKLIPYYPNEINLNGEYWKGKPITHPQLAFILVKILELDRQYTIKSHVDAYHALLSAGIAPIDGWRTKGNISVAELATVVITAVGNPDAIDLDNPGKCVEYLNSRGCNFESVISGLDFIKKHRPTSGIDAATDP